jgi:sulfoquinovose isomerase
MNGWLVQGRPWSQVAGHTRRLEDQAHVLLSFFQSAKNPHGGFFDLDVAGRPLPTGWPPAESPRTSSFQTTRLIHCYGIAHLWGRPGSAEFVDHGMDFLWNNLRDRDYGGYFGSVGANGPADVKKQAYAHAFVLLAASTAKLAGHPDADRLLTDISEIIDQHFWDASPGVMKEEFQRDWTEVPSYRGANSNMHTVEALLAGAEATGDSTYVDRAMSITQFIIGEATRGSGWRVPEHYNEEWSIDPTYDGGVYRPYGSLIGHWLEWSRLCLQLWVATGKIHSWLVEASTNLFANAIADGWDKDRGGLIYTVDFQGKPIDRVRYWWPCAEGISAAYWLGQHCDNREYYESVYRMIWSWVTKYLATEDGYWLHQLDDELTPMDDPFYGPDLYHVLQAMLIPTVAAESSLAGALASRSQ